MNRVIEKVFGIGLFIFRGLVGSLLVAFTITNGFVVALFNQLWSLPVTGICSSRLNRLSHWLARLLGIEVKITQACALPQNAIYIVNHQNTYDFFALGFILPEKVRFVAHKKLKKIPFLGWFMALTKTHFVAEATPIKSRRKLRALAQACKLDHEAIVIFPEGKRTFKKEVEPFRSGAFFLARENNWPVLLVGVSDLNHLNLSQYRHRVNIHIEPFMYQEVLTHSSLNEVTHMAELQMQRLLLKVNTL